MGAPYAMANGNGNFDSSHLKRTEYPDPEEAIQDYQNRLSDYMTRNISDDSDILNAFKGIATVMKRSMEINFWYGCRNLIQIRLCYGHYLTSHKRRDVLVKGYTKPYLPSWT